MKFHPIFSDFPGLLPFRSALRWLAGPHLRPDRQPTAAIRDTLSPLPVCPQLFRIAIHVFRKPDIFTELPENRRNPGKLRDKAKGGTPPPARPPAATAQLPTGYNFRFALFTNFRHRINFMKLSENRRNPGKLRVKAKGGTPPPARPPAAAAQLSNRQ